MFRCNKYFADHGWAQHILAIFLDAMNSSFRLIDIYYLEVKQSEHDEVCGYAGN